MVDTDERSHFLRLAALFEGGLILVALALGFVVGIDPFADFHIDGASVLFGCAAALPPFLLLRGTDRFRFSALERIKGHVLQLLGPALATCRWYELAFVAALAGLGEELLFRGMLQRCLERWLDFGGSGRIAGLVVSNIIFGLLHLVTPTYAILAAVMGIYFGVLLDATQPANVVVPILAHGLYDFLAFLLLRREANASRSAQATVTPIDAPPQPAEPASS